LVIEFVEDAHCLKCPAATSDFPIRAHCEDVGHRPNRLIAFRPHEFCNGMIRVALIVNFGRVYKCFIRRPNLPNVLVPDIGNALFGNQPRRIDNSFVPGMGNFIADALSDPRRRQGFCKQLGYCIR